MANSKQFGAFGLLRKSIGSVTYSKGKDSKGKTIQIAKAKPTSVLNPNTANQILQRCKIKPAQRFYTALSMILDHSFEGVAYGNESRIKFMSEALKLSGPYIPKGVTAVIPADYKVSEGSMDVISVQPTAIASSTAIQALTLDANAVAALVAANVPQGAQLTIIAFYKEAGTNNYKFAYGRLINEVGNIFAWTGSTAANMAVGVKDGKIAVTTANGQATVAVAAIASQLVDGTWKRSTQSMVLTDEYREGLYNQTSVSLVLSSYKESANGNAINSAWYLNLANGQPFPGSLEVSEEFVSENDTARVIGGVLLPPNGGSIKFVCFTDDGTSTGKLKIVSDQGEIVDGTAAMTAYVLENTYDDVALWVDTYATQLGF